VRRTVIELPSRDLHNSFTSHCDTPREGNSREDVMGRFGLRIVVGILMVAALVAAATYTYNLGVARGIVESGRAVTAPGGGVPVVAVWHPWGFGFFPFLPLLFILFWVFALRGLFWRAGWRRPYWRSDSVPPAFEEWHRRVHAAETSSKQASDAGA
jgi:hypothetical protein